MQESKIISDVGSGLDRASQRSEGLAWMSLRKSFPTPNQITVAHTSTKPSRLTEEINFVPELGLTDSMQAGHSPELSLRCYGKGAFYNKSEFTNASGRAQFPGTELLQATLPFC